MGFVLPTFNLLVNIWRNGNATTNPPDVITVANLTPGRRTLTPSYDHPAGAVLPANMHLLVPPGTDIRDNKAAAGFDTVEVPAGSARFYEVDFVDDIGGGFHNEHRFAQIRGIAPWPTPFPMGTGGMPVNGGAACGVPEAVNLAVLYSFVLPVATSRWFWFPPFIPPAATPYTLIVSGLAGVIVAAPQQGPLCAPSYLPFNTNVDGTFPFFSTANPPSITIMAIMFSDPTPAGPTLVTFRMTSP